MPHTDDQIDDLWDLQTLADRHVLDPEPDPLMDDALTAICRIIDGDATNADLQALRAWATHLRLQGYSEEYIASLMAVIRDLDNKLGEFL